jgi:acetyl esterase/lipase
MRRILLIIALCNAAASPHVVRGETRHDGQLLSAKIRAPLPAYEALDDSGRGTSSRQVNEQARAQQEFDVLDIRYASDGLEVPGVLIRPKDAAGRKWPAIIYNRGGTGDYGKINDLTVVNLYLLAKAGFVVIASDYRFHDATAKRDEWGGGDLNDVAIWCRCFSPRMSWTRRDYSCSGCRAAA